MARVEFSEKSFEAPLNVQLSDGGSSLFAPDQVLEHSIGFDAAVHTLHHGFWSLFGGVARSGSLLCDHWFAHRRPPARALPPWKLNVFLQYKRPEHLTRPNASQWSKWKKPYYRFIPASDQQMLLEECATGLGEQGIVAYACPAFSTYEELFTHTKNGSLVPNSHFVEAQRIKGHHSYTYAEAGSHGIAFSEPEPIPNFDFERDLAGRIENAGKSDVHPIAHASRALRLVLTSSTAESIDRLTEDAVAVLHSESRTLAQQYLTARFAAWLLSLEWFIA